MNDEYKEMLERFEQICQNAKKELCVEKEKEQEKRFIEKIDKELTISEYDEIEYWLANVEVLDNTDYILNNRKAKILVRYLKEKQQEIERLHSIIKEVRELVENGTDFKCITFRKVDEDTWKLILGSHIKEDFLEILDKAGNNNE